MATFVQYTTATRANETTDGKINIDAKEDSSNARSVAHLTMTRKVAEGLHNELGKALGIAGQDEQQATIKRLRSVIENKNERLVEMKREICRLKGDYSASDMRWQRAMEKLADAKLEADRIRIIANARLAVLDKCRADYQAAIVTNHGVCAEIIQRATTIRTLSAGGATPEVAVVITRNAREILAALDAGETPEEPTVEHAEADFPHVWNCTHCDLECQFRSHQDVHVHLCPVGTTTACNWVREGCPPEAVPVEHAEATARKADGMAFSPTFVADSTDTINVGLRRMQAAALEMQASTVIVKGGFAMLLDGMKPVKRGPENE